MLFRCSNTSKTGQWCSIQSNKKQLKNRNNINFSLLLASHEWAYKLNMGKKSSHFYCSLYCNLNYMIIMKCICFVIIMRGAFAMESSEQQNKSATAVPVDLNDSGYSSTSKTATAASAADFDVLNANAVDGAPMKGWQCHCWNSTNGLEVCKRLNAIFILSEINWSV